MRFVLIAVILGALVWGGQSIFAMRDPISFHPSMLVSHQQCDCVNSSFAPELLNQHFSYIGRGTQMIAFVGDDQKTVLKLFLKRKICEKKRISTRSPLNWIPAYHRMKQKQKAIRRAKNLASSFACYIKAFEELRSETGLIGMHLSSADEGYPLCQIQDFDGKIWEIDLNRASFMLQKRATPVKEMLASIQTEDQKRAFFDAMETLLETRARKGFKDLGQGRVFDANYGFIGDQPIMMDAGRLGYSEDVRKFPEPEIEKMQGRLRDRFHGLRL